MKAAVLFARYNNNKAFICHYNEIYFCLFFLYFVLETAITFCKTYLVGFYSTEMDLAVSFQNYDCSIVSLCTFSFVFTTI